MPTLALAALLPLNVTNNLLIKHNIEAHIATKSQQIIPRIVVNQV